ncbi:MAG: cytochrome ubiquinol oxidase subunit I, partial [Peptococcaceae bacterium]|nr:cytochrome ubiquinol oxidase subunit I [Peptococcaceae bacterium]
MDVLILSRIQFGLTGAFHFIFPALSIGLAWLNVIFLAKHRKTQSEDDLRLAYFWINVFCVTFAMGVATGVVMVFQFGSNWGDYTNYVGNMFGAPLAAEAIIAFFLEATFMGILIWGRNKVSQGLYRVSAFLVAFGATVSAFLIIAADSWMQTPAGYQKLPNGDPVLDEYGRPLLDNFLEMVFNPSTMPRFTHTIVGCMIAASMMVLGISAWFLLKKQKQQFALKSMRVAIVVFLIFSVTQWVVGHWHTVQVVEYQPAKLAAFEGLFETDEGVELLLFGIPNAET